RLFKYKESFASSLTIGAQCVLLPENQNTLVELARRLKQAGADYFSVKHFYNHPGNRYQPDMAFRTPEFLAGLQSELAKLAGKTFQVTLRNIGLVENSRQYSVCHGLPFIVYVREDGQLYTCFSHQEDPQAVLGNLGETDFASLWRSTEKKAAIEHINQHYDKKSCQANCRHHEINQWLEQLSTPPPHVNFV
ncbi:MAG: SPASM domain-containing protein, partial [Planctomycetota bacterium]|nr:SPASM domain-containing protein [Planctomycetota bacterium]